MKKYYLIHTYPHSSTVRVLHDGNNVAMTTDEKAKQQLLEMGAELKREGLVDSYQLVCTEDDPTL